MNVAVTTARSHQPKGRRAAERGSGHPKPIRGPQRRTSVRHRSRSRHEPARTHGTSSRDSARSPPHRDDPTQTRLNQKRSRDGSKQPAAGECTARVREQRRTARRVRPMLRPASWTRPAGVSPAWVGTGAPSSRPRSVGEIWRAERGVESLFGGSKITGRSVKRTLQPRQIHNGRAKPLISRRRPCLLGPVPGVSPGGLLGVGTAARAQGLARNRRDPSAHAWRRAETGRISRW